jgi:predicted phage terminase large subunit-like protein
VHNAVDHSMFGKLAEALEDDWGAHARPEQISPPGAWAVWLILAGRGWGKTRTGAEWVRSQAEGSKAARIALVGATASDVRDVMIEGESGILAISPDHNRPIYSPSKRRLEWSNGAIAAAYSAEEPDRLRGPQHSAAWIDELASFANLENAWAMLQFGMRLGKNPQQLITTTPRSLKLLKQLIARADCVVTRGSTYDNRRNLPPSFFSQIITKYEGTRLGRQELDAELLEDIEGALWSSHLIEATRLPKDHPLDLKRVVISLDPAISVGENSDSTGLIVCGIGHDNHGYVLEDITGKYSPTEWAMRAIAAYKRHKADRIVAEANQGGAMVESTLRAVDATVPVKLVHASRGKITRAEPISALYEQGRVHHVGGFPELEDEMCSFEPGSAKSPDRMDALVWALTELMITAGWQTPITSFTPPTLGLTRSEATAANFAGLNAGYSDAPPGGWPASSPQARSLAASGGMGHWTPTRGLKE